MSAVEYYSATLMYGRWYFYMPAEHGPPEHYPSKQDICVGPYDTEISCQRQADVTKQACILCRRA